MNMRAAPVLHDQASAARRVRGVETTKPAIAGFVAAGRRIALLASSSLFSSIDQLDQCHGGIVALAEAEL
jgi:hypothetical protein